MKKLYLSPEIKIVGVVAESDLLGLKLSKGVWREALNNDDETEADGRSNDYMWDELDDTL